MRALLVLFVAFVFATPAFAGMKVLYSNPQHPKASKLQIDVAENGDMRIDGSKDGRSYLLSISDDLYFVDKQDSSWRVIRFADILVVQNKLDPPQSGPAATPPEVKIRKLGKRRINGWIGTAYQISWNDSYPLQRTEQFVVSDDPALAVLCRGLMHYQESLLMMMRPMASERTVQGTIARIRRVFALGTLIDSPNLRLERVETMPIDPARMALPVKPMTIDEIIAEAKAFDEKFGAPPSPDN